MKKFLLGFLAFCIFFTYFAQPLSAQAPTASPAPSPAIEERPCLTQDEWCLDPEVTFAGQAVSRAASFLDWVLANPNWVDVSRGTASFISFWSGIRNIVYAFSALFVLITAFVLVITRGRSVAIMQFVPRFVLAILLVTFSFALIQFLYQITDIVQNFFLTIEGQRISSHDIISIGYSYQDFIGYRKPGASYEEATFISVLLAKITAVTLYILGGVLLVRKIILWLFIAVSPIFPFLLLYAPIRNVAKIWLGQFFRWLLYAPLFSIFLFGLVSFWKTTIPLQFNEGNLLYETSATNLLLGGPSQDASQVVSVSSSVNTQATFALYVVSLIMIWVVVILPFLLLKIFFDYAGDNTSLVKQIISMSPSWLNRFGRPGPAPTGPSPEGLSRSIPFASRVFTSPQQPEGVPPLTPGSTGIARPIPLETGTPLSQRQPIIRDVEYREPSRMADTRLNQAGSHVLREAHLSVPTLRDIARFDTEGLSVSRLSQSEASTTREALEKIGNPSAVANPIERQRFQSVRNILTEERQNGNSWALAVLSAAGSMSRVAPDLAHQDIAKARETLRKLANPSLALPQEAARVTQVKEQLTQKAREGNSLAASVLPVVNNASHFSPDAITLERIRKQLEEAKSHGDSLAGQILDMLGKEPGESGSARLPEKNRIQTVSLDDYEAVKKMWHENYKKLDVPGGISGQQKDRKEWIQTEIIKVTEAINLLSSHDAQKEKEGMQMVSKILPFLLIGGFSKEEVVAYLKAKQEAAKQTLEELTNKDEEESTLLDRNTNKAEEEKTMAARADLPEPVSETPQKNSV